MTNTTKISRSLVGQPLQVKIVSGTVTKLDAVGKFSKYHRVAREYHKTSLLGRTQLSNPLGSISGVVRSYTSLVRELLVVWAAVPATPESEGSHQPCDILGPIY